MCIFIFIFIISYIYLFFTYILLYSCKLLLVQLAHKNFTHMQHDNKSDLISVIIVYSLCHNVFQVLNISNQFVFVGFFLLFLCGSLLCISLKGNVKCETGQITCFRGTDWALAASQVTSLSVIHEAKVYIRLFIWCLTTDLNVEATRTDSGADSDSQVY